VSCASTVRTSCPVTGCNEEQSAGSGRSVRSEAQSRGGRIQGIQVYSPTMGRRIAGWASQAEAREGRTAQLPYTPVEGNRAEITARLAVLGESWRQLDPETGKVEL
jgi:hypothetical protein